mmetsp:Transcript_512/g.1940  ORF Transcript_512/g.1940 Transcript_512/m.1940 type:complete len:268 (-) Transcript_512:390-1193(-)
MKGGGRVGGGGELRAPQHWLAASALPHAPPRRRAAATAHARVYRATALVLLGHRLAFRSDVAREGCERAPPRLCRGGRLLGGHLARLRGTVGHLLELILVDAEVARRHLGAHLLERARRRAGAPEGDRAQAAPERREGVLDPAAGALRLARRRRRSKAHVLAALGRRHALGPRGVLHLLARKKVLLLGSARHQLLLRVRAAVAAELARPAAAALGAGRVPVVAPPVVAGAAELARARRAAPRRRRRRVAASAEGLLERRGHRERLTL